MSERDYYEILGITADADGTTVNKTYWNLARKYQAQATSDPRARSMLDELNQAYNVLGTPALRDEYDANRIEPRLAGPAVESYAASGRKAFVAPKARGGGSERRDSSELTRWMSYAGAAALAIAGAGLGMWAGNLLLAALAGSAGALIAIAPIRHTLLAAWRKHATQAEAASRSSRVEQQADVHLTPRIEQPLNASIVHRGRVPADELRTSTASMVGRWRASAASGSHELERAPDSTLVDIFRSEQEIEAQSEPLSAVLEVLRGSRSAVESR